MRHMPPSSGSTAADEFLPQSGAALLPTGNYSTGDGLGWQPSATAGLACVYSPSEKSVVLCGGVSPGLGRSADVCIGEILPHGSGEPPTLRWEKRTPSMSIPPRCFHGAALLAGSSGDKLLLFGGEGNPNKGNSDPATAGPTMMNDLWEVQLRTGRTANLITTAGAPPTPRTHIAIAALKDPPPPAPKLALGRLKKGSLSMIMAGRASVGAAKPSGADKGPAAMAAMAKAKADKANAANADPRKAFGSRAGGSALHSSTSVGSGSFGLVSGTPRVVCSWTVLVIGGRAGAASFGEEDALHVLRLSEAGEVRWIPSLSYMREAIRKRQQQQRVSETANAMIAKGKADAEAAERGSSPPGSPPGSPRAWGAGPGSPRPEQRPSSSPTKQRGQSWAAKAAAAKAEAQLNAACAHGKAAFRLLQRRSHTSVVAGSVALVFGGIYRGQSSADLVSVRFRDLATAVLPASGAPPPARHSHAATAGGGGMIVCGGIHERSILDDLYHLALPQLTWSRLRLPSSGPSRSLSNAAATGASSGEDGTTLADAPPPHLARHGHSIASISYGEVIVYGGYAATSTKMDVDATGGFAPNRAAILLHSTPAAALAVEQLRSEQSHVSPYRL